MKTKKLWMLLAVIFFIAGIGGCATTPPIRNPQISEVNLAPAYLITGVPYIRQGRNECGPTSLAMVLSFYDGKNGQKKEVVAGVMPAGKFYTPVEELENYARQRGFNTYRFCDATQNKAKIKFLVSQWYPLIVIGRIPNNWHSKRALWQ